MLPNLTPLQYLTLHLLFVGPRTGRQLRGALRAMGVRHSGAAFSRLMMRLVVGNLVDPSVAARSAGGRTVHENRFEITDLGVRDWMAARKFHLNLAPPSADLVPTSTESGALAAYDAKTRQRVIRNRCATAFKRLARGVLEKRLPHSK
ncbi:MAG: hypothetical protein KKE86_12680 [Planctomycetes bacterium]|nr:hypothetical protein [Planctomycetota bacterium]MBU4400177.1 hypothetical protein [Planctomycetota bacterium]MCG2682814.1 hypothetical protein [Planctomycetales bacterium]